MSETLLMREIHNLQDVINDCLDDIPVQLTEFGTASIEKAGYYRIISSKEGNYGKRLHRLIYEKHYGKIPEGYHIHHIDGDKLNNEISNLECLTASEHVSLHMQGNNHMSGKHLSDETKMKMSKAHKGMLHSDEHCKNISKARNTTGFYRVDKHKHDEVRQGYVWRYRYYEGGEHKELCSVDIKKLEEKVRSKGLKGERIGKIEDDKLHEVKV